MFHSMVLNLRETLLIYKGAIHWVPKRIADYLTIIIIVLAIGTVGTQLIAFLVSDNGKLCDSVISVSDYNTTCDY